MRVQKLESTDAFIVFDLEHAEQSVGVTRLAPKILVDGVTLLARSMTYQFASFEVRKGGASAGINAKPDGRDLAVKAFVDELEPIVRDGRFLTDAAKGLTDADLARLRSVDVRDPMYHRDGHALVGTTAAVAAERAVGGLEGCTVAIEGFDRSAPVVAAEVSARGAKVTAVSTDEGSVLDASGFDPTALGLAHAQHGAAFVHELGAEPGPSGAVFGAEVDVVFVGSRVGAVDHVVAGRVCARALVPIGAAPVTAKGLAVLRRAGVLVLPDFVTTAGPMFAAWPGDGAATVEAVRARAAEAVAGVVDEVRDRPEGPFLAACLRAEAFLRTWCDTLPFGRPLA